jgi:hypothetical protein
MACIQPSDIARSNCVSSPSNFKLNTEQFLACSLFVPRFRQADIYDVGQQGPRKKRLRWAPNYSLACPATHAGYAQPPIVPDDLASTVFGVAAAVIAIRCYVRITMQKSARCWGWENTFAVLSYVVVLLLLPSSF